MARLVKLVQRDVPARLAGSRKGFDRQRDQADVQVAFPISAGGHLGFLARRFSAPSVPSATAPNPLVPYLSPQGNQVVCGRDLGPQEARLLAEAGLLRPSRNATTGQ